MARSGTPGERLARVEEWQEGHEELCTQRQVAMGREIRELKDSVGGLTKGAWGIILALLEWTAAQVYEGMKADARMRATAAVIAQHQAGPREQATRE